MKKVNDNNNLILDTHDNLYIFLYMHRLKYFTSNSMQYSQYTVSPTSLIVQL